ncbi:protein MIS12 homolog isoform X1 [Dermacentor variabilis]|uniref:protein MIS12 homolog isoform X1 n=1 Tax=Dermacentor variabilis TaxID=34621 RepID=UPI003F5C539D
MTDNSYAVQHFGVSPKNIVDCVYNIWFDYTEKCLDDLKTALQDKASGRIPPDELEASVESIFQEMVTEFNKNADKLEEFMQYNITHVPSHVLLPEDDVHRQLPDERRPSVSSLRAQLGSLHRRIAQETARQQALKEELARQDVLREQLKAKLRSIEEVAQQAAEMSNKTTMVPAEGVARLHPDTQDVPGLCREAEGLSGATGQCGDT